MKESILSGRGIIGGETKPNILRFLILLKWGNRLKKLEELCDSSLEADWEKGLDCHGINAISGINKRKDIANTYHSNFLRRTNMKESILNGKRILAVNDNPDILAILEEEIIMAAPNCYIDKANHCQRATELLASFTYDLVILDMMLVRVSTLLNLAVTRPSPFPVVMLTAYTLNPETLRRFTEMGVRAYLPKEKLGEIVPFLEDFLRHEYLPVWGRIFEPLQNFFNTRRRRALVEVPG